MKEVKDKKSYYVKKEKIPKVKVENIPVPETIPVDTTNDMREKGEIVPELKPGGQINLFGLIDDKLSNNNEVKDSGRKKMTPEEREQRKKDRENLKQKEIEDQDQNLEMFFSPVLGGMFLNIYILKVLKVEDNPAQEAEINAFTDSVKGIAKKYMNDAMKNNIELVNFALVMTSVTLSRVDINEQIKKLKGVKE